MALDRWLGSGHRGCGRRRDDVDNRLGLGRRRHVDLGTSRHALDDPHLAFGFRDLQLGDVGIRDQVDQGLEFAQIHEGSCRTKRKELESNPIPANFRLLHALTMFCADQRLALRRTFGLCRL